MTGAMAPTSRSFPSHVDFMTIGECLKHGTALLASAGIADPGREAVWLLEAVLGMSSLTLQLNRALPLSDGEVSAAMAFFERRASREPLQYVLGTQEFCGLEFVVGPEVLIPRPETELLVQFVEEQVKNHASPRIADIGTGSGCIAVTLAHRLPSAHVYATELSHAALALAAENARRHGVSDRIVWLNGDLTEPLQSMDLEGRFAAIVSNPPYIRDADFSTLQPEVGLFEPRLALAGGPDGLDHHRRLLHDAFPYLQPGGWLIVEVGRGQTESFRHLAETRGNHYNIRIIPDEAGIDRVIGVQKHRTA
ncbi:MAG TPA: peptide chain release factor N(5)-glutamine methyltransferase [Nitrospiraceae bacterium]|jgi:release factor glutamine methyltransferase|nr:peptide chain release factor N(5)-glutamine methyltransferase [Nitrospiraceae bacterium]